MKATFFVISNYLVNKEDELVGVLRGGYSFTEPIPRLPSVYPTPDALIHVNRQLAEVYKSYLIRSVLSLKGVDDLLGSIMKSLEVFAPFADISIYQARDPNPSGNKERKPPLSRIQINTNVETCHWYRQNTLLCQVTFNPTRVTRPAEEIQFQTKSLELPLAWFQFSCQSKKFHGTWKPCCRDQFVILVLKVSKKNSNILWENHLIQSICHTPIPDPETIKKKLADFSNKEHLAKLRKENPNFCDFDINLYWSILQLALPEEDRSDCSLVADKNDNKESPKESPKDEPTDTSEASMEAIKQERLKAQELRTRMEEEERDRREREERDRREREERDRREREERDRLRRQRRELEQNRPRQSAPHQQMVTGIKPKKKINKKKINKKGPAKPKPQLQKSKLGETFSGVRSKQNEPIGYLPRTGSKEETVLPDVLLEKLADIAQQDHPTILIKESPPTPGSSTDDHSPVEESSESSGTTTPTTFVPKKKWGKRQTVKFSLHDERLISSLKALEVPAPDINVEEHLQDGEFDPELLQMAMEQSAQPANLSSSSSSLVESHSSPTTIPGRQSRRPRGPKNRFSGSNKRTLVDSSI